MLLLVRRPQLEPTHVSVPGRIVSGFGVPIGMGDLESAGNGSIKYLSMRRQPSAALGVSLTSQTTSGCAYMATKPPTNLVAPWVRFSSLNTASNDGEIERADPATESSDREGRKMPVSICSVNLRNTIPC